MLLSDTHCDTLYEIGVQGNSNTAVTQKNLEEGGVTLQVMAMWTGRDGNKGDVDGIIKKELAAFHQLLKQGYTQVLSPAEQKEGQVSIMLSIEGGEVFEPGLYTVEEYHRLGVRMAALLWNNENKIGFPAKAQTSQGLTDYGLEVVKEMQRLHIAADVSHLNDQGFYDIFLKTHRPPMASHSNCRSLRNHFRNLTDDQIRLMIQNGGYIGINFYPYFLTDDRAALENVVQHIDHVCQLGGDQIVGFGSDFDGIEIAPIGLEGPEKFPDLLALLKKRGYSQEAIERIAGQNLIDYFNRIA